MSAQLPQVRRVGVIGAGTMGAGITASCITAGLAVTLVDSQASALARARQRIEEALQASAKKGRITAEAAAAAGTRVAVAGDIAALGDAGRVLVDVGHGLGVEDVLGVGRVRREHVSAEPDRSE